MPKQPKISFRRKSGIVRSSSFGVKTRRGKRVYIDTPSPGCCCLIDDIHRFIVRARVDTLNPFPYTYKVESYGY